MSDIQRYLRCARSGDILPDSLGAWCKYDDAAAEIERLREENRTPRNAQKACADCDAPTVAKIERLREAVEARDEKIRRLVATLDDLNGTPCEQIRHAQEIERLRGDIAEIEKWKDEGERIAAEWGEGGNAMVQSSVMFKLGVWWERRPWNTGGQDA